MLKCQCLTCVVDVWKGEFDMTIYVFCSASARQNIQIELTLKKYLKNTNTLFVETVSYSSNRVCQNNIFQMELMQ